MKRVKDSVAVVIHAGGASQDARAPGPGVESLILLVRRPKDDPDLPGIWGLPAATLGDGEDCAQAVRRVGRDKLGVELEPGDELREGSLERADHRVHMRLFEARIVAGQPTVPQPDRRVTQYSDWQWGDPRELLAGARKGSLCCRLYLRQLGRGWT